VAEPSPGPPIPSPRRHSGERDATLRPAALQKLLAWLSPSFPVGAYSYSHGLEWAIEDGTVTDASALEAWIGDILSHGAGRSDAILFCHAWLAARSGNDDAVGSIGKLAAAFQPSRERHLEATAQGRAFLLAVAAAWPNERLTALAALFAARPITYALAVALAAAAHDVPLRPALTAMLNGFLANLVSAGVRAIPIGQTDGQRIIAALSPVITEVAAAAESQSIDELGGAALRADIASMKHETQYTRLFRS
jgi:urease accessory protein